MPAVIVEIAAPHPSAELTRVLLDACSSAVRDGDCEAATDDESRKAVAIAIVRWDGPAESRARIQVGVRRGTDAAWQSRAIEFRPGDARAERWRTVGLTIATLAGSLVQSASNGGENTAPGDARTEAPLVPTPPGAAEPLSHDSTEPGSAKVTPPAEAPSSPPPPPEAAPSGADDHAAPEPAPPIRDSASSTLGWMTAGGVLGPGLNAGGPRLGAFLDGAWLAVPVAFARVSIAFAERPRDENGVSVQWFTATAGAGLTASVGPFSAQPRVAASLERLRGAVTAPSSGRTDADSRVQIGVHVGADLSFQIGHFGVVGGIDAYRNAAATTVIVGAQNAATDPQTGWSATLGVRYHFASPPPRHR